MMSSRDTNSAVTSGMGRRGIWRSWPASVLHRFTAGRSRQSRPGSIDQPIAFTTAEVGGAGERAAARYLSQQGYRVLAHDVRAGRGQIDLVAREGSVLCFVEVKTRRRGERGAAVEAVTPAKQARMVRAAMRFLLEHRMRDVMVRFDVVAVTVSPEGRSSFELVRNAFDPGAEFSY